MNFYVILLSLVIQGLALGCCEEYNADNISGEGSWDQGEWSGSGDTTTGENDNFTRFDSRSSSTDKDEEDKQPKFYPRISQTHSNRIFVTSGVGEDKGGSQQDERSYDNSEKNGYQENTNKDFGSSMDLSKVGDAIDVMKRLKKAKSDQEFAKKLRSGAKVVMHSIVDDMMHNTGRTITQKLGKMLNNTIDMSMKSSGSAVLDKDDGSTEPEQKHRTDTVHHQADLLVQKVSIDFIKNVSNTGRKSSLAKPFNEPSKEKVKVSFLKRNMNESKRKLKTETDSPIKNTTSVIQEMSGSKENGNVTSIREKSETRSTSVPKIALPVSLTKDIKQRSNASKALVTINNDTKRSTSDASKREIQKEEQNLKKVEVQEEENNSSEGSSGHLLGRGNESRPVIMLRGTDSSTQGGRKQTRLEGEKPAVKQSSAITMATNDHVREQNNTNGFFLQRKVSQNEVNTSLGEKERVKKTGKAKVSETMRVNFLERNKTSLSDPTTTLSYVIGPETRDNTALLAQLNTSNTPLHQKSNSRADSQEQSTSRKSTSAPKEGHKGTYPTGLKGILNGERNQTNKEPDLQRDKNNPRKGSTGKNRTITSDALQKRTKSEKIVIKMKGKEGASEMNKANDTVYQNNNIKATETHEENEGTDIDSMQQNGVANMKTYQIKETNAAELTNKGTDDNSVRQQVKSSTINVERKEERSGSLTSTNVLTDRSTKRVEESKITSEAALTVSTKNRAFTKEKIFINRKNITKSERGLGNLQNDGIANNKKATLGDVQRTLNKNSRIIVQIKNRKQIEQNAKGKLVDSISSALMKETQRGTATSVSGDQSQQKISVTLQKLGNSKGTIRNVKEKKTKQDSMGNHNETKKDQTNARIKSLENKENIEIKPDLKSGEPSVKETSTHGTDSRLESKEKTGSESYLNDTEHSHGNSNTNQEEKHHRSFSKKILVSHEEKSYKPESENRGNAANGPVKTRVTQRAKKGVMHKSGSGSKDYSGSGFTRDSGNDAKHDPGSGAIQELETTTSDLLIKATKRYDSKHVSDREIVKHGVSHSPQQESDTKSKQLGKPEPMSKQPSRADLESVPPQKDTKHEHFNLMKMSEKSYQDSQASRKTNEERPPSTTEQPPSTTEQPPSTTKSEDHQLPVNGIDESAPPRKKQSNSYEGDQSPTKENEKSLKPNQGIDDKVSSSKLKSSSPGREQTPAEEDKKSSRTHQVEVLTSRTPPTSLLTTSSDDNTYSIKQIVQGPRGSSYVYGIHNDDKVHNLEKKVSKLESEVTVLETAMADLAKRLLVVEQNSEVPKPTMPTTIHSSLKSEADAKHSVHNQQTNVYVSKGEAPKLSNPEKIVIPISSLFSERAGHENKPSHSIHEIDGEQEAKVDSRLDNEDQEKSQDSVRLSSRGGAQPSPLSEAHAVVRPIVNIIVPNNGADLFPDGVSAACIPRCQNGGRCLEGNTCRCPTFFTGDHCERFSLKDLLESSNLKERPYRKPQRIVVSEPPDRQILDGALNLDPGPPPTVEYRDVSPYRDINQDILPAKQFVAKQQPTESTLPTNSAEIDGGTRRRQLILEI